MASVKQAAAALKKARQQYAELNFIESARSAMTAMVIARKCRSQLRQSVWDSAHCYAVMCAVKGLKVETDQGIRSELGRIKRMAVEMFMRGINEDQPVF